MNTTLTIGATWRAAGIYSRPIEPTDAEVLAAQELGSTAAQMGTGFVPTPCAAKKVHTWTGATARSEPPGDARLIRVAR